MQRLQDPQPKRPGPDASTRKSEPCQTFRNRIRVSRSGFRQQLFVDSPMPSPSKSIKLITNNCVAIDSFVLVMLLMLLQRFVGIRHLSPQSVFPEANACPVRIQPTA